MKKKFELLFVLGIIIVLAGLASAWTEGLNTGLWAYWKFDEGTGTNAMDSVLLKDGIPQYNLTVSNNWETGIIGSAKNLTSDSNNTAINLVNEKAISVNMWLNRTGYCNGFILTLSDAITNPNGIFSINCDSSDNIVMQVYNGTWKAITTALPESNMTMFTLVSNLTNFTGYVNGEVAGSFEFELTGFLDKEIWFASTNVSTMLVDNIIIDELGIWNRTLDASEVSDLYNSGNGVQYIPSGYVNVSSTLSSPIDNGQTNSTNQIFSANYSLSSAEDSSGDFINATLNIWDSFGNLFGTNFTTDFGATNSTSLALSNITAGVYTWNYETCAESITASQCGWAPSNFTLNVGLEYSEIFNSSTVDDYVEGFGLDIAYNNNLYSSISAVLNYGGTNYAANKSGTLDRLNFTTSQITTPGDKNFYWNITLISSGSNYYFTTTQQTQEIITGIFSLCNSTLNIPYLNFTFEEEGSGGASLLSATIDSFDIAFWTGTDQSINNTYTYSNSTEYSDYAFCYQPSDKTIYNTYSIQFNSNGYVARRFVQDDDLTNITTNQILYLLNSSDGIYSTYQVQSSASSSIPNVKVQVERQINAIWTMIEESSTDSAGAATFWLSPSFDYRMTFTKASYNTIQITLRPSSSTYTVIMDIATEGVTFNNSLEGLLWKIYPNNGRLEQDTNYTFEFNVTASKGNLISCKMELVNITDILVNAIGCGAYGGNISVDFMMEQDRLWGKYYLDVGDGYVSLEQDAYWMLIPGNMSGLTIKDFLEKLKSTTLDNKFFGTGCGEGVFGSHACRAEFSRIVFFFFILFLVLGIISYKTGWDFGSSGGLILLLFPIILFISYNGWFTIDLAITEGIEWIDKYVVSLIAGLFTFGWIGNKLGEGG